MIILPETVSGSSKEGAIVPKGIIVDGVAYITNYFLNE